LLSWFFFCFLIDVGKSVHHEKFSSNFPRSTRERIRESSIQELCRKIVVVGDQYFCQVDRAILLRKSNWIYNFFGHAPIKLVGSGRGKILNSWNFELNRANFFIQNVDSRKIGNKDQLSHLRTIIQFLWSCSYKILRVRVHCNITNAKQLNFRTSQSKFLLEYTVRLSKEIVKSNLRSGVMFIYAILCLKTRKKLLVSKNIDLHFVVFRNSGLLLFSLYSHILIDEA
jgi:hypothetical protein